MYIICSEGRFIKYMKWEDGPMVKVDDFESNLSKDHIFKIMKGK